MVVPLSILTRGLAPLSDIESGSLRHTLVADVYCGLQKKTDTQLSAQQQTSGCVSLACRSFNPYLDVNSGAFLNRIQLNK